jgi:hypothetical protein
LAVVIPEVDLVIRLELNLPVIEQVSNIIDYYDGNGRVNLTIRNTPVQSVTSVTIDQTGYFGQGPSAFTGTALVAGIDYALVIDDPINGWARAGQLTRINGFWPSRIIMPYSRLAGERVPLQGAIKIVYTAGLTDDPDKIPFDLQLAANLLVSQIRMSRLYPYIMTSEGLGEYHYALSNLLHGMLQIGTVASILAKRKDLPI